MAYAIESPILGPGSGDVAGIQSWFELRGRAAAPAYGKGSFIKDGRRQGGTYTPIPEDLAQAIVEESRRHQAIGVVVDDRIASAQIDEETAGWQSEFARERLNPGGIGAEDDNPDEAYAFPTLRDGIRAHISHMLTYAAGTGPWNASDPRFEHTPVAWRGSTKTLQSLAGRWATQPRYGEYVRDRANSLSEHLRLTGGGPMAAQIRGFTWQAADGDHHSKGRQGKKIKGGAQHYSAGTNSLPWLTTTSGVNSGEPVSAHFLIRHNPTMADRGWQMVRLEDTAWATGGIVNPIVVAIEYEHLANQSIPDIAYEVMAQTWVDIAEYVIANGLGEIKLTRLAIKGHKEWVEQPDRVCPDGISVDRIVSRAVQLADEPSQPLDPSNPWFLHLGGGVMAKHAFRLGFRGVVEGLARSRYPQDPNSAALALVGEPKEDEWEAVDGHSYQRCKRLTLHYIPGQSAPWDVIFEPSGARLPDPKPK